MKVAPPFACTLVLLSLAAGSAFAQDPPPATPPDNAPQVAAQLPVQGPTIPAPLTVTASSPESGNFFKLVGGDFKHFFSKDSGQVLSLFAVTSIAAVPWDRHQLDGTVPDPQQGFKAGNIGGSFAFQVGLSVGTYGFGAFSHNRKAQDVGRDLMRAQIVSQSLVQAVKVTVRRERPDGSNNYSFPSGHSASAFATASVLQRHFGWKVGVPAYAFGVYVASARMADNKHYISDVIMGAGIGIAAGRTVTMKVAGTKFGLGVAPTVGGAQVTFTRKQ